MSKTELKPCPFCGGEAVLKRAFMAEPTLKSFASSDGHETKYFIEQEFCIKCKSCRFSTRDFIVRLEIDRENLSMKESFDEKVSRVINDWNGRADNEQRKAD